VLVTTKVADIDRFFATESQTRSQEPTAERR
jgi:hypothetical protein